MKIKKNHKTIISVVLSLWIFFMGFELGSYTGSQSVETTTEVTTTATPVTETTTQVTTVATTESTTAAEDTTDVDATVDADADEEEEVTEETTEVQDVSTYSTDQILEKMNEAMATLEAAQNFTASKEETISVTVTDCTVSMLTSTVNSIVQGFVGSTSSTYTFVDGVGTETIDGTVTSTSCTAASILPPEDQTFNVSSQMVTTATATQSGDNVIYSFTLIPESTTIESGNDIPAYHSTTVGYLDLLGLELPDYVTISEANMNYHGSTVTITVDSQGRITTLDIEFPMDGEGTATVKIGLSASGGASFEGGMDNSWTFSY